MKKIIMAAAFGSALTSAPYAFGMYAQAQFSENLTVLNNNGSNNNLRRYPDSVEGFEQALNDCKVVIEQIQKTFLSSNLQLHRSQDLLNIINALGFDSQIMLILSLLHLYNPISAAFIFVHFPVEVVLAYQQIVVNMSKL